jgi:hypothetical protein
MIDHRLRCRKGAALGAACHLARVRVDDDGRLYADARLRMKVHDVGGETFWQTHKTSAPLDDLDPPYLLLSCEHDQSIPVQVAAVRRLIRENPRGVSFHG